MTESTSNFRWRSGKRGIRDRVLRAYEAWPSWPRRLRQILALAPAYGSGDEGIRQMCGAHNWDVEDINSLIASTPDFKEALDDLWSDGHYRHALTVKGKLTRRPVSWEELQFVYASEAAIGTFIKAEGGIKPSKPEMTLLAASGLLDGQTVEPQRTARNSPSGDDAEQDASEDTDNSLWPMIGSIYRGEDD